MAAGGQTDREAERVLPLPEAVAWCYRHAVLVQFRRTGVEVVAAVPGSPRRCVRCTTASFEGAVTLARDLLEES